MIDSSDDETNFPHKLLLTNRQVANLCKSLLTTHRLILNCQKPWVWNNNLNSFK